jgi:hypothetical protein
VARGWGRSEEDLAADKEQVKEGRRGATGGERDRIARETSRRRGLELSLARVEDLLSKTENPDRRRALETARSELMERLQETPAPS